MTRDSVLVIGLALALFGPACQDQQKKPPAKKVAKKDPVPVPKKKVPVPVPEKQDPVPEKKASDPEKKVGGPLRSSCKDGRDCAEGLFCHPKMKDCLAEECELGSSTCKKGTECCPLPAAMFPSPLCLPNCRDKPQAFCGQLLGANAQCNAEMGCCHYPKVLKRPR
jgi:hypothetical protein